MAIAIPKSVFEAIKLVQQSGATNMLDRPKVVEILRSVNEDVAADWIEENKKAYSHGIFQGFQATEESGT